MTFTRLPNKNLWPPGGVVRYHVERHTPLWWLAVKHLKIFEGKKTTVTTMAHILDCTVLQVTIPLPSYSALHTNLDPLSTFFFIGVMMQGFTLNTKYTVRRTGLSTPAFLGACSCRWKQTLFCVCFISMVFSSPLIIYSWAKYLIFTNIKNINQAKHHTLDLHHGS